MPSEKLSGLTRANVVAATDLLYMVLNPGTTPISRGVLLSDVLAGKIGSAEIKASIISGLTEEATPESGDFIMGLVGGSLRKIDIGNMVGISFSDPVNSSLVPDSDSVYDLGDGSNAFAEAFITVLTLAGTSIAEILSENDMASASASALATQQSIKFYSDHIRQTSESADFTIAATHLNKTTRCDKVTDINVTFPANATFAAPVGFRGVLKQVGDGKIVFDDDGGAATIRVPAAFNLKTAQKWSAIYYEKVATDTWEIVGDLEVKTQGPNEQTGTTYTLALSDNRTPVIMNSASANKAKIPSEASLTFPNGARVPVWQGGAGVTTIQAAAGVSLNGVLSGTAEIQAQYNRVTLLKAGADAWYISGDHGAVGQNLLFVASDTQQNSTTTNVHTTTHTLDGGGSNRTVLAFLSSSAAGGRTLQSVTLNGVAGTIIYQDQFGTPADDLANTAIAYWLDVDHPGAGSFDVVHTYDNAVRQPIVTVVELQDTSQSVIPDTKGIGGVEDVAPNDLSLDVATSGTAGGQIGEAMLTVLTGWNGALWDSGIEFASTNADQRLANDFTVSSAQGLWLDEDIASDPITYTLTATGQATAAQAWRARSVVVHRA